MDEENKAKPGPFISAEQLTYEEMSNWDIEVLSLAQAVTNVEITGTNKDAPFKLNFTTNAASTLETNIFALTDIPIWLSVKVNAVEKSVNDCFVMVYLRMNGTRQLLLCQGMIGELHGLSWPHSVEPTMLQRRGKITSVTGADPAANAEWTITVPAGQFWELKALEATLVTDANAASRRLAIIITYPDGKTSHLSSSATQTANQTVLYSLFVGAVGTADTVNNLFTTPLPLGLILPPGSTISSAVANRQVGDNWGAPIGLIEIYFSELT